MTLAQLIVALQFVVLSLQALPVSTQNIQKSNL